MTEFKIGADPEFFVLDTTTGKHVSAFNMIPGTKAEPHVVEGGAVQVDGMALEFNIDPANSFKEFNNNINKVLGQLRAMVPERYAFSFVPVAQFGQEYIDAQPDVAKELGCDPDFNAWTGAINPKPDGSLGIRTASGHVHIGWTEGQDVTHPDHIEACQMMSKQLDFFLGIPSLMWDTDEVRRTMYGDFGCYRPKHYGVEYRTLSNAWVNDVNLRKLVYYNSVLAGELLMQGVQAYTANRPEYINTQYRTNRQLFSYLNDRVPMSEHALDVIQKYRRDETPRNVAVEWAKKMEGHYFWQCKTYKLRHYNELTQAEYNTGEWVSNSNIMNDSKFVGMSYEGFLERVTPKAVPKPSASPWDVNYALTLTGFGPTMSKKTKRKPAAIVIDDFI